jgi:hypothetical protein
MVWAAFHFFSDFSFSRATGLVALSHLGMRLFTCVTLSFVIGLAYVAFGVYSSRRGGSYFV